MRGLLFKCTVSQAFPSLRGAGEGSTGKTFQLRTGDFVCHCVLVPADFWTRLVNSQFDGMVMRIEIDP